MRLSNTVPAFNAALVLYAGLLIQAYAKTHEGIFSLGDISIRRELLPQAIQCLMSLDRDNPMTEKCARYTSKLEQVLSVLGEPPLPFSPSNFVLVLTKVQIPRTRFGMTTQRRMVPHCTMVQAWASPGICLSYLIMEIPRRVWT